MVTVLSGQVAYIEITPWPITNTSDDIGLVSFVGYDADGNENWTWTPSFDWEGLGLGIITQIDSFNYTVDFDTVGFDKLNVSVASAPAIYNASDVTISSGQVAAIEISPWPSVSNLTGDTMYFHVLGYDADGNENSTWTPIWTWDGTGLGTIILYNYQGNITFVISGSDTINVSASGIPSVYNSTLVTVSDIQPEIDYIAIMDAPGGLGSFVTTMEFGVGEVYTLYAAGFNLTTGEYVGDVSVTWSVNEEQNGTVIAGPDIQTTFTANFTHGGELVITITNSSLPYPTNSTGSITVLEPNVDFILIRDAPNGGGDSISLIQLNGGEEATYYAAGYNLTTGLFVNDVVALWSISPDVVSIDITEGSIINITASSAIGINATGTLQAVYNVISNQTVVLVNLSPSTPSGLTVTQVPIGGALTLTWAENSEPDVLGYMIYRSTTSGGAFNLVSTVVGKSNTTHIDTNLADGTTYYYYLVAYDDGPNFSSQTIEVSGIPDMDTDGDGRYNLEDPDDDDDGLSDTEELTEGDDGWITDPLDSDSDDDGFSDSQDDYPLDETRWEKKGTVEPTDFPWLILVIIIIVVVILLILLLTKKRQKPEEEMLPEVEVPQTQEDESFKEMDEFIGEGPAVSEEPQMQMEFEPDPHAKVLPVEESQEEAFDEEYEEEADEEAYAGVDDELEFECPECGYPVSDEVNKCPNCGTEFEDEEDDEEYEEEEELDVD
jgi:hypothetical protein